MVEYAHENAVCFHITLCINVRLGVLNFINGCPKAALLFWFFSNFRCGMPLFIVILVIYKYTK